VAAALLVATQNYPDKPGVTVMLLVSTLAGLVVLLAAARQFARRASPAGAVERRPDPVGASTGENDGEK
jgi:BASS family bile acid:Na+ symporter